MLATALTVHFRYGDRSEQFEKSMKGLSDTLGVMKRLIASGIAERLRPVFENSGSVTSVLFDPAGKQFQENYVSPVGSEVFKDALFAFVQSDTEPLCDYRRLIDVRDRWLFWSRVQSWTCLAALIVECLLTAGLFISVKLLSATIDLRHILWTIAPISFAFILFVGASIRMAFLHDRFVDLRKRYANP